MMRISQQPIKSQVQGRSVGTVIVWGPWKTILLAVSFLILIISSIQVLGQPTTHESWALIVSVVCLTWLVVYFLCTYRQLRTLYLVTTAYILLLCLFHLGITIPHAFGWTEVVGWTSGPMSMWYERAGWYTAIALGSIGMGFGAAMKPERLMAAHAEVAQELIVRRLAMIYWTGLGLLCASAIFLAMGIYSVGNILAFSRNDFFRGVGDTRGLGAFLFVFPGALILLVIGARKRFERLLSWSLAGLSFILIMLSGYRTVALGPLMMGIILWVKVGRKVPTLYAAIIFILILILIPIVGKLRAIGAYEDINKQAIETSMEGTSIANVFTELGGTASVAANVFRLVPDEDPYRFGTTYLQALGQSIPNITSRMGTSVVQTARELAMNNPSAIAELPPGDWLTYKLDPERFKMGQGIGFSGIAEPYLNFGLLGVIGYFALLGYLLGRLDQVNLFNYPKLFVFSCAILWTLMRTVRDQSGNFIKPAVFVYVTLFIWWLATKLIANRKYN